MRGGSFGSFKVWQLALAATVLAIASWLVIRHAAVDQRVYRIGWESDIPFQMTTPDGQPAGMAIDLVREAARRRNIRLQWIHSPEGGEKSLRAGKLDLWPLLTILPERRRYVHITDPYLETEMCFLVRQSSPYNTVADLANATISTSNMPPDLRYVKQLAPRAKVVSENPSVELVRNVCTGRSDASLLDLFTAVFFIFEQGGCSGEPLRWITVPGMRPRLGVGSVFGASAAADALRDEIGLIVAEGSLEASHGKWAYMSGLQLRQVEELVNAQRRERWLRTGIAFITILLLATMFQTLRIRRERNRTRQAERALRDAEQKLRLISNNLNEMVLAFDMDAKIIYANPAVERLTGYTENDLRSNGFLNWVHPDDAARMMSQWTRLFQGGSFHDYEYRLVARDGTVKWASATWGPILDEKGFQVGVQGCERDVTERKSAEAEREKLGEQLAQARKMESIGRLAGGVAHDFNNLLTVINGESEMAISQLRVGDPLRETLREILRAGERAAGLTRQLLAFSRKQVLQPQILSLNPMVDGMKEMLARLMREDIELKLALSPECPTVQADLHQLEQIVMNLAVNARDAMPRGGQLTIATDIVERDEDFTRSHPDVRPGRYAVLAVTDTGSGMDEETRQNIFEPFFTTKEVGKGTGLGLSTVQGIVAQSGGYIDVVSQLGVGSTFTVCIPAVAGEKAQDERPGPASSLQGTETILVVEDQPEVRKYTTAVLRRFGYRVIPAAGPGEALTICQEGHEKIDLVLTDVVMPQMNGPELATHLEKLRPGIKALFMSGYTGDIVEGALDKDMTFVQKPFTPKELAGKLRAILGPPRA